MADDNEDTCTICLECVNWNLGEKDGIVLKCNHAFHVECIFQYAIDVHQCPNCRCELKSVSLPHRERNLMLSPMPFSLERHHHTTNEFDYPMIGLLSFTIIATLIGCFAGFISYNHNVNAN